MKLIEVADRDHERVTLLARAWQATEGEVVRRLLDEFAKPSHTTSSEGKTLDGVPVYADYEGSHIEALYYPSTKRMDITSGALSGRSYKSPSGAAIGVVQAHNPNVHPNRNGWSFWFLAENGQALQTIRNR